MELYDFSVVSARAIEHIIEDVVDKQMRLVAWNRRYLELFNSRWFVSGQAISDVIRHNGKVCGPVTGRSRASCLSWNKVTHRYNIRPDGR